MTENGPKATCLRQMPDNSRRHDTPTRQTDKTNRHDTQTGHSDQENMLSARSDLSRGWQDRAQLIICRAGIMKRVF